MNGHSKPGSVPFHWLIALALCAASLAHAQPLQARFVVTPSGADPSTPISLENNTGHVTLHWETAEDADAPAFYQVEQSLDPDFASTLKWYEGHSRQAFISGIEDGDHYYRVRSRPDESSEWGGWSEPLHIRVERQSLTLAWGLFATGAGMFACIVGFIVYHTRREARGGDYT